MPGKTTPNQPQGQTNITLDLRVLKYALLCASVVAASYPILNLNSSSEPKRPDLTPKWISADVNKDGLDDILLLNYDAWMLEDLKFNAPPIMAHIKRKDGTFYEAAVVVEKDYVKLVNNAGRTLYKISTQEFERRVNPQK